MAKVNANDRQTLKAVYPADAFARDAARNQGSTAQVLHGVRVGSAPDKDGWFDLEPTSRHAGEPATADFLTPVRHREELTDQGRAPSQAAAPRLDDGYDRFLDDVVAAAQRFGFRAEQSPSRDPRLRGFRGG